MPHKISRNSDIIQFTLEEQVFQFLHTQSFPMKNNSKKVFFFFLIGPAFKLWKGFVVSSFQREQMMEEITTHNLL